MDLNSDILKVEKLNKYFGGLAAVSNCSLKIKQILSDFIDKEGYDIPNLVLRDCWINWYTKDQHATPHTHDPDLSVVFFVDVEDSGANFLFHSSKNFILTKYGFGKIKGYSIQPFKVEHGS